MLLENWARWKHRDDRTGVGFDSENVLYGLMRLQGSANLICDERREPIDEAEAVAVDEVLRGLIVKDYHWDTIMMVMMWYVHGVSLNKIGKALGNLHHHQVRRRIDALEKKVEQGLT